MADEFVKVDSSKIAAMNRRRFGNRAGASQTASNGNDLSDAEIVALLALRDSSYIPYIREWRDKILANDGSEHEYVMTKEHIKEIAECKDRCKRLDKIYNKLSHYLYFLKVKHDESYDEHNNHCAVQIMLPGETAACVIEMRFNTRYEESVRTDINHTFIDKEAYESALPMFGGTISMFSSIWEKSELVSDSIQVPNDKFIYAVAALLGVMTADKIKLDEIEKEAAAKKEAAAREAAINAAINGINDEKAAEKLLGKVTGEELKELGLVKIESEVALKYLEVTREQLIDEIGSPDTVRLANTGMKAIEQQIGSREGMYYYMANQMAAQFSDMGDNVLIQCEDGQFLVIALKEAENKALMFTACAGRPTNEGEADGKIHGILAGFTTSVSDIMDTMMNPTAANMGTMIDKGKVLINSKEVGDDYTLIVSTMLTGVTIAGYWLDDNIELDF